MQIHFKKIILGCSRRYSGKLEITQAPRCETKQKYFT